METRNDLDMAFFRQRLNEEKLLAEETIARTRSGEADMAADDNLSGSNLDASGDNHPADMGTDLQMREQDDALIVNAQDILKQIEHAMARMAAGTYGVSEKSGKPIAKERLEAVPYATLTVEEQEIEEATF